MAHHPGVKRNSIDCCSFCFRRTDHFNNYTMQLGDKVRVKGYGHKIYVCKERLSKMRNPVIIGTDNIYTIVDISPDLVGHEGTIERIDHYFSDAYTISGLNRNETFSKEQLELI